MAGTQGSSGRPPDSTAEQTLSFEQARDELAAIVAQLEAGGLGLEESLRLWQRGEDLVRLCQTWLDQAQASIARAISAVEDEAQPSR